MLPSPSHRTPCRLAGREAAPAGIRRAGLPVACGPSVKQFITHTYTHTYTSHHLACFNKAHTARHSPRKGACMELKGGGGGKDLQG